ncbi:disease resistance protein RPM1-like [Panicum miliaceum]|uniref:Disease resistance protein RPM1-like n=1 Tax=Panicum miliaceum TaxID=4540 RepID=A0A3L6Q4F5_PANMI|nr:disease resistance protein RPM1-like [Panicum miliaceum]
MEATVVSLGKAMLDGALGYAKSATVEEMAQQLDLERDVTFVTDEMEIMQSFLMTAVDGHQHQRDDKLLTTWVKQVRDVAYNVEDNLVDFAIQAEREKTPRLGCVPRRNLCDRRRIANEVKELRANKGPLELLSALSNRNERYRLIKDGAAGGSKLAGSSLTAEQGGIAAAATAAMFGVDHEKAKVDLLQLVSSEEVDLRVIAVWGTTGDLGKMSEICKVVDDPNVRAMFGCHAWLRLTTTHPFDPKEFLRSMVRQFCEKSYQVEHEEDTMVGQHGGGTVGGDVMLRMEKMGQSDLVREFSARVSSNRPTAT